MHFTQASDGLRIVFHVSCIMFTPQFDTYYLLSFPSVKDRFRTVTLIPLKRWLCDVVGEPRIVRLPYSHINSRACFGTKLSFQRNRAAVS